uniref:Uncharacterized protein n=1 Tax=Cucumis melo TaxID=3656 RepID=A0A9I9E8V8_CUCME
MVFMIFMVVERNNKFHERNNLPIVCVSDATYHRVSSLVIPVKILDLLHLRSLHVLQKFQRRKNVEAVGKSLDRMNVNSWTISAMIKKQVTRGRRSHIRPYANTHFKNVLKSPKLKRLTLAVCVSNFGKEFLNGGIGFLKYGT